MGSVWTRKGQSRAVGESDLKLCALCGALNYKSNHECFTCGWTGHFEHDVKTIHVAWLRLKDQFDVVSLSHVTRSQRIPLGEFGLLANETPVERASHAISDWWRGLWMNLSRRSGRDSRRPIHFPGNELGV